MIRNHTRKRSLAHQNARAGVIFSLPFIIGFIFFTLFPIIQSIILCFHSVSASESGMQMNFKGLEYFHRLFFEDATYLRGYLIPCLKDLAINFPSILIFSFFIAVLINQKFKGRILARIIFFLPVIISSGVIALVQNNQLQTVTMSGIANAASDAGGAAQILDGVMGLFANMEIGEGLINFIEDTVSRIYDITVLSGVQILIYLAGLQTISPSLYEASSMEGATGWENFWKITFPMISPLILVNSVYTIVDIMSGLNNPLVTYIYQISFENGHYGLGSAMGWIYFLMIAVVLFVFIGICSRLVYYET